LKRKVILVMLVFSTLIGSLIYYNTPHIQLFGFTLAKRDLSNAIIYMDNKRYWVHDTQVSQRLAILSSKLKKFKKPNTVNQQIPPIFTHIPSFDIQTQNNATYGGPVWKIGSDLVLDINGYYWVIDKQLLNELENATKTPGTEVLTLN
jgi:hypothetical protein